MRTFADEYGMLPSTVTTSASQPLSPPGTPILPPGLVLPAGQDRTNLVAAFGGLAPGLAPQVGGDPVLQAIAERQLQTSLNVTTKNQMLSGEIERSFRQMKSSIREITDSLSAAASEIARTLQSASAQPYRTGVGVRTPKPPDSPEGAAETSAGRVPSLAQMAPGVPEGAARHPQARGMVPLRGLAFRKGADTFSLAEVGERAAGHFARTLQNQQAGWEQVEGEDTWVRWHGKGKRATAETAGPLHSRMLNARVNAIGSLGKIAEGESISSVLPGLGRFAGPAGFAVGGAMWAAHTAIQQREANRAYQQVTGGSNVSVSDPRSGLRQRLGAELFSLSQFGTMSGGMARDLHMGATQTGLQGGARQDALDFATAQFKRTGMDVAESIQLIQMNVRSGVETFGTLSEALSKVSQSARDTGQNVQVAQRAFTQTLGAVQSQVTPTAAAPTIAAGIQEQITKQGRLLGGQLDFAGMLSQPALMMQAAGLGKSPSAYMAKIQGDPALLGQGLQSQVNRIRDAVFDGAALTFANGEAKKAMALTGGKLTPADAANIGRMMAENGMLNPTQFLQVAAMLGMGGVTPANVYEVAAKVALGSFRFDEALSPAKTQALEGGGKTIGGQKVVTAGDYRDIKGGDTETAGRAGAQNKAISQALGLAGAEELTGAGSSYLSYIHGTRDARGKVTSPGTGTRSAVMEALLRDEKGLKEKHFVVQTKDGPKTVDFETAFKNFSDQLARGDVVVQETGDTVAQTTGKIGDTSARTDSAGAAAPKGAKDPTTVAGSVTIYADDELKRIIRIVTSGGPTLDQSRRQGIPGPAFPATPNDYPHAGG